MINKNKIEVIEEIAHRAGYNNILETDSKAKEILEKYTEFLILEVAKICENSAVSNLDLNLIRESSKYTVQELATNSCGKNLSEIIKKHFGVINE